MLKDNCVNWLEKPCISFFPLAITITITMTNTPSSDRKTPVAMEEQSEPGLLSDSKQETEEQEDFIAFTFSDEENEVAPYDLLDTEQSERSQKKDNQEFIEEEGSRDEKAKRYRDQDPEEEHDANDSNTDYNNRTERNTREINRGRKRARSPVSNDASSDQQEYSWSNPREIRQWQEIEAPWSNGRRYRGEPAEKLHDEIIDFINYIEPTAEEHEMRLLVVKHIEKVAKQLWNGAELFIFGSFDTRLYLPSSDIDVVITAPHLTGLHKARLKRNGVASNVRVVHKAKVPIIKIVEEATGYPVDISLNITNGISSARTVKRFSEQMPALKPIMLLIKQFLTQRGMNEVFTGGLSSYSLMIMTVSFLQMHPLVQTGQIKAEENLVSRMYGINFAYDKVVEFDRARNNAPEAPSLEDPNDLTMIFNMYRVRQAFSGAFEQLKLALIQSVRDPRANKHPTLLIHGDEMTSNGGKSSSSTFTTTQASRISYIDGSDEDESFNRMAQQMLRDQGYSDEMANGESEEDYSEGELTTSATNANSSTDLDNVVKRYSARISSTGSKGKAKLPTSDSDDNSAFDALIEEASQSKRSNKTNGSGRHHKRFKHKSKGKGRRY
ncbi:hypothetical protein BDF22DRAFT_694833 [Syncephalis plumigaleata]|nr:hypothetical protein BDF22DRAFT_694833 [Syncephalis plumigaleata]